MLELSQYSLMASLILVVLALVCYIVALTLGQSVRRAPVMAHAGRSTGGGADHGDDLGADGGDRGASASVAAAPSRAMALFGTYLTRLALVFLTACLVLRTLRVADRTTAR